MNINELTEKAIGVCIEVHRHIGPGLLETVYQQCRCHELTLRGIPFQLEFPLRVKYKGIFLDCGYRVDLFIDGQLLLELKSIEKTLPIHEAQLLTYLRLGGWKIGLLINFNVKLLTDGIVRKVMGLAE
jgi:GxxExxY protein